MTLCVWCGRMGGCGGKRICPNPRHPENIEREARERRAARLAEQASRIADEVMENATGTESLHALAFTAAIVALKEGVPA